MWRTGVRYKTTLRTHEVIGSGDELGLEPREILDQVLVVLLLGLGLVEVLELLHVLLLLLLQAVDVAIAELASTLTTTTSDETALVDDSAFKGDGCW